MLDVGNTSQRQQTCRANLGLQLSLERLKEPLDQPARRGIARGPVEQLDVQLSAGQPPRIGMINLGVVDIQLAAGSVRSPGAKQ